MQAHAPRSRKAGCLSLRDCHLALINHLRGLPVEPVDEFLIAPTEDFLQEILHRLVLCSRVLGGRDLCPCI